MLALKPFLLFWAFEESHILALPSSWPPLGIPAPPNGQGGTHFVLYHLWRGQMDSTHLQHNVYETQHKYSGEMDTFKATSCRPNRLVGIERDKLFTGPPASSVAEEALDQFHSAGNICLPSRHPSPLRPPSQPAQTRGICQYVRPTRKLQQNLPKRNHAKRDQFSMSIARDQEATI